jgi:hypothetical protein
MQFHNHVFTTQKQQTPCQTWSHQQQKNMISSLNSPPQCKPGALHEQDPPSKVLQLSTLPVPALPSETSVLVRVCSTRLHPGGSIMMQLVQILFRKSPAAPETISPGVVVAVGSEVLNSPPEAEDISDQCHFPVGGHVFGSVPFRPHLKQGMGTLAEYVAVEMDTIAQKPPNISFEKASCLAVSGATALALIEAAKLKTGQKILFSAPCDSVGYFACQVARQDLGPSGLHVRFGGNMGFDKIIDAHGSQELWNSSASYLRPSPDYSYTTVGPAIASYSVLGMLGAVRKMLYYAMIPTWLGGVQRTHYQIASFVDAAKLDKLRSLVNEEKLKVEVGGD